MRRLLPLLLATVLLVAAAGMAVAKSEPTLAAHGPTEVSGTEATAVFRVGSRLVRQVRYADQQELVYSFVLANEGRIPVTVTGLAQPEVAPRLFRFVSVRDPEGREEFSLRPGARTRVEVVMRMQACETLSARAGSFANEVSLSTRTARMLDDVVTVDFPEQVHTGSPREAFCPNATATSRPPG